MAGTKVEKLEEGRRPPGVTAPPEGGWGWMIVASCFLATICIRAVTRCVSMFFVEFQLHFEKDYSTTSWINSLIDATTMLCAPLGGFLGDRLSCRATVILGGLLSSSGLVLSSFASSLEYLYISLGILPGLGFALSYTPAIAMVGRYFSERKALAYGIAMSGSGIGTLILAPAVQLLIEYYSWRGALLILGGFVSNLCVCGALMRPTIEDSKLVESKKLNKAAADMDAKIAEPLVSTNTSSRGFCLESREEFGFLVIPDFLILSVSLLFLAYGCSAPVVYLIPYALSMGVEPQQAAFLMSIFGVSGIVGNITFGWITDRQCLKKYRMLSYMMAIGMDGLCCMFIHLLHSFPLLVPFSVLYGYFDGAYVALIPVVTSDVAGSTYLTSALGVVFFLHGIPYLISPPIGGWLVDRTGNYKATFFLSGACFMFSSAVLGAAMLVRRCRTSKSNSAAHLNPNHTAAAAQQNIEAKTMC
uniref:Solute carrier family 16 member 12 n=1 Tax=Sander lucioperca TaxID=283035 RepID=A0A8D0CXV1_SANLU